MNVLITNNKNGTLTVNITVEPADPKGGEEFVDTRVVKNYLNGKKKKYGKCLKSAVISNTGHNLIGEWIFENPTHKPEKTVDKASKSVIPSTKAKKPLQKIKEKSD